MVNRVTAASAVRNAVTSQPRAVSSGPKSGEGRSGAGLDQERIGREGATERWSVTWVTTRSYAVRPRTLYLPGARAARPGGGIGAVPSSAAFGRMPPGPVRCQGAGSDERGSPGGPTVSGRLVLAATPMGDIGDASQRLRDALATADVVAAEDTRRTRSLAKALGVEISGRVVSFYDHVETARIPALLEEIE